MAPTKSESQGDLNDPFMLGPRFAKLKSKLIAPEYREAVTESWKRLLRQLEKRTEEIAHEGSASIPVVHYEELARNGNKLPNEASKQFKDKGCVMVKGVVPRNQIDRWFDELKDFCREHPETGGYTFPNPTSWYNVFWCKPQTELRCHPNMQKTMSAMSKEFHVSDPNRLIDLDSQIVYGDRVRIRYPGTSATLPLHLDSGSTERYEDDTYRSVYKEILEGRWEDWDPFNLEERVYAVEDLYYTNNENRATICSSFRTLQGWISLSDRKSGEGTLKVLPNIKMCMAYVMLRPLFLNDPISGDIEDYEMDLHSSTFPGATPSLGQLFLPNEYFPHLQQQISSVSIPDVEKGDFVFWHADTPHEVDRDFFGEGHSSVMYYAHTPLTIPNITALLDSRNAFTENRSPDDYRSQLSEEDKRKEFQGADIAHIHNEEGLRSMGFKKFDIDEPGLTPGQKKVRELANMALEDGRFDHHEWLAKQKS